MNNLLHNLFVNLQFPEKPNNENGFEGIVLKCDYEKEFTAETAKLLNNNIKADAVYYVVLRVKEDKAILPEYKEPQILFYDFSTETDKKIIEDAHKAAWNYDKPLCFMLFGENDLRIYNAFEYVEKQKTTLQIEEETTVAEKCKKFSFWKLQSGKVWEDLVNDTTKKVISQEAKKQSNRSHFKKKVTEILLHNISYLYEQLTEEKYCQIPLNPQFANRLVLRLIFVRYLIDRGVEFKNTKLFGNGLSIADKKVKLYEIIADKNLLQDLFSYCQRHFLGKLFDISEDENLDEEIHLRKLRNIFEGKAYKNEYYQWNIFDFAIIPIEIISGIYENILDVNIRKKDAAIYTPPFIADYILDSTVKEHIQENLACKILDPACGSGIFLVQTFRRIVQERQKKGTFNPDDLINIAKENLYGIDKNSEALNVALFSIYIAILDFKTPAEISDNGFPLPNLIGTNLFCNNFFNTDDELKQLTIWSEKKQNEVTHNVHPFNKILTQKDFVFDFIIGNPPWFAISNDEKTVQNKSKTERDKELNLYLNNKLAYKAIAKNISQAFVLRAKEFAKPDVTQICFIITSKAFYNLHAEGFKKYVFENFKVTHITDFSVVRGFLFAGAINPAFVISCSVPSDKKNIANNPVTYLGLKNNIFLSKFKKLVIGSQDYKKIKQGLFIEKPFLFKVALYGNNEDIGLLDGIISNYGKSETLETHFKKHKTKLFYGDGISALSLDAEQKIVKQIAKSKEEAKNKGKKAKVSREKLLIEYEPIRNIPIIETEQIKLFYSEANPENFPSIRIMKEKDGKKILINDLKLKSGRKIELYKGAKILLRRPKYETHILASYIADDTVYRSKVYGMAAPHTNKEQIAMLKEIYGLSISNIFTYYQYLTSSSWGVFHPEIYGEEYMGFPYRAIIQQEYFIQNVDSFIERCKSYYERSSDEKALLTEVQTWNEYKEINKLVNEAYEIDEEEQDYINYVLDIARYEFQGDNKVAEFVIREPKKEDLKAYAQIFTTHYCKIYNGNNGYFQTQIYEMEYFIVMKFNLVDTQPNELISFEENATMENIFRILAMLSIDKYDFSNTVFIQKDVRGFEKDFFYIIKPRQIKSWHKAIARQDLVKFRQLIRNTQKTETYA